MNVWFGFNEGTFKCSFKGSLKGSMRLPLKVQASGLHLSAMVGSKAWMPVRRKAFNVSHKPQPPSLMLNKYLICEYFV